MKVFIALIIPILTILSLTAEARWSRYNEILEKKNENMQNDYKFKCRELLPEERKSTLFTIFNPIASDD